MDRAPIDLAPAGAPTRAAGTVRWFAPQRGFGFVEPDDGGEDVFVTFASLPGDGFRQLLEGQRVTFTRGHDAHGPVAVAVAVEVVVEAA